MITYEQFNIPQIHWDLLTQTRKSTFVQNYFKENGIYPTPEQINNFNLSEDERERFKRIVYARYVASTTVEQPDVPTEEKIVTFSFNKENENTRGLLDKYEYDYLTFRVEYCEENDENPSETYLDTYCKYRPYAYGVFNKIDDISISLKLGYKYRFYVYYRPSNQGLPSSSYGYVNDKGWLYVTNNFVLSNERVWYYGTGDVECGKGYFAITDFNPKESNVISISLKKVYAMVALSIKNYINECIDINVSTIHTLLQGGDNETIDFEFNHINSLGFCSIHMNDNILTYEFPITYKTSSAFRNDWKNTVENACDAAMRGEEYSELMQLSVNYKKDFFDDSETYKPLLTQTVDIRRGQTIYVEMDLENPELGFDFDIDIEGDNA